MELYRYILFMIAIVFANSSYAQYINASPNPATIPLYQTQTTVTISWGNSSSTTCVWWTTGNTNGGQTNNPPYCGGASGSNPYTLSAGTYTFWIGNSQSPVAEYAAPIHVTVNNPPTGIWATPNPVTVPSGQSSAPVTINWNEPGYSSVSWYGTNSLPPYNGETLCLGSNFPSTDTINANMSAGEIAHLYIVPNDNCTAGTVVSSIPTPILATTTITTQ